MNARDRLRAYLEQRRELGESELVLDALGVDDVLRMVGAAGSMDSAARASASDSGGESRPATPDAARMPVASPSVPLQSREEDVASASTVPTPQKSSQDADTPAPPASSDWREMMATMEGAPRPRTAVPSGKPEPTPPATPAAPAPSAREPRTGTLRIEGIVVPLGLKVERPPAALLSSESLTWQTLTDVTAAIAACRACGLASSATQSVPGIGNPDADVMVVGEAPGEREDAEGEPFVGPAGQLLTKILGAIQLSRDAVYICNVLKHRPPNNRNPLPDEVRACAPFLQRQIDLVQPKLILAFGTFAAQSLLGTKLGISKLRQQIHWYQGIPTVATYHPAALLRNDAWKRPTWEDMKLARKVLDATVRA
jgi:uracil-DNA glycosylase